MSTTTLPKPFSAYVGLLASTVGGAADTVRHPTSVTRLPLLAVSSILMARERYDEMAERGELVLQGVLSHFGGSSSPEARRGSGARSTFDQVQGRAAARVADAGDHLEEHAGAVVTRLHDAAEQASRAGQRVVGGPGTPLGTGARAAASAAGRAAERVEKAADVVRPPSPVENMATEVAAPPTTDRGAIDDAPAAGDAPIPPAARKAAAKKARKASPRAAAKKATAPAKKAVPAAKKATPGTKPTAPAPALAQEAAGSATAGRTDAPRSTGPTAAVPPALLTPPPAPAAVTSPIATAATVPSPIAPTATVPSPTPPTATPSKTSVPTAGPGTTSEAAPAPVVPAGHTDGLEVPAAVKEAAGPLRGHADLPLADFDHMTMGSLRGRLRTLDAPSLVQLLDYEQAHGSRLPILTLLQNRLRRVLAD